MSTQLVEVSKASSHLGDSSKRARKTLAKYLKVLEAEREARKEVYASCREMIESLLPFMSGTEIGKRIGVSRSYISLIRSGFRHVGYSTLESLIRVASEVKK